MKLAIISDIHCGRRMYRTDENNYNKYEQIGYQTLHKNIVKQLQSLLEPMMIVFLAVIVGIILLSVMMPMFDIYSKIQ